GLGSDSGIENGRSSSSIGPLEEGRSAMDQQSQGNGGHFFRSSVFRNALRTIGNEGNSDKIGQLFDSIQSQKTVQTVRVPGVINCTADSLSKLDSQGDYSINPQLAQILFLWWNLETTLEHIHKPIQRDSTLLCIYRPEGLKWAMDWSIQPYMGERNPLDPSTYPNDILDFNDTQTVMNYSDCGGTLVARPTLVHNTATR
ncbi:MAG: hypothetical protein EZS28_054693, partial [Streblomastix strix]